MYTVHAVVEMPEFRSQAKKLLDEDEIFLLITQLAHDPTIGAIIAGTGGFRKLRLARRGGGKSGGYRAIYFFYDHRLPVLLVSIYAKNKKDNLTLAQRNQLAEIATKIKQSIKE